MDELKKLQETCDELGRAWTAYKSEVNAQIAKGVKDAISEANITKLGQAIDDLTGKKDDLERRMKLADETNVELERKINLLRAGGSKTDEIEQKALRDFNSEVRGLAIARGLTPEEVPLEGYRAYKSGFMKYVAKGEKHFTSEEVKAMQVGIDADGGYLVPPDVSGRIVTRLRDQSPIRQIADVQSISSDRLEGIEDLDEADAGWVGEIADRNDTDTPQVGKYEFQAHELYAQPKASQKLLDDSSIDLEGWLAGKVADKFARLEGDAYINGNGVAKPRGFASYTTAATADATRAWGQFEHILSGASADFAASNPADKLFDLEGAFKPHFLNNATFVTRRSVITKVRKFKGSDNNYLWQPGLQAGKPAQLIGYPVMLAEHMPALAADSLSLALGDFREGYQIVDRLGVRVLRDPYTAKPYVRFYTIKRTGGGARNFEAIKFLKFNS